MNEQRTQAYLNLIQQLLDCPQGEENKILQANAELVDGGLIQVMEQVAAQIAENGDENTAQWLGNLARQLVARLGNPSTSSTSEAYFDFLMETLQKISENPNPQLIYFFWAQNLNKLDEKLGNILENWAKKTLSSVNSRRAYSIAIYIGNFSNLIQQFPLGNIATNKEIAITGYKVVLTVFTFDSFPQNWAMTQNNLATAYFDRIKGNRAENLEQAIACYQEALKVYNFDDFPKSWAMTQNNLGNAYLYRIKGDKNENLELAIAYYKEALKVRTFENLPDNWANTQNNLATAYSNRIRGNRSENLEQAITCCQEAFKVYTFDDFPQQWATTQNNLGMAYRNRIKGNRSENLEQAIAYYQEALKVYTFEVFPQNWATTQNNLGIAYIDRIRGDITENLEQAINCYQEALRVYTFEAFPQDWATTQDALAIAYRFAFLQEVLQVEMKSNNDTQFVYPILERHQDKLDDNFAQILQQLARNAFNEQAVDVAVMIINLCTKIKDFPLGNRASNLEIAIAGYEAALTIFTFDTFPTEWAGTQHNLGNAYHNRIQGKKAENLEEAITHFQAALEVRTREAFPKNWAATQQDLGAAYLDRIQGEKAENLEEAIAHFQAALEVHTREAFPENWAMTQNNLGTAYLYRIRGEKAENLEDAIAHFQAALAVHTREAFPENWAMTQNNLGTVYLYRIRGEKAENLEDAIACYQAALKVRTREAFPADWAATQNNLGMAYTARIRGKEAENLEQAITCYQAALEVRSREAFPADWAATQDNLGIAYFHRIQREKEENLETAIACYQAALAVRTREAFPQEHVGTLFDLGLTYQTLSQLSEAKETFAQAIDTMEFLRGEIRFGSANEEDKRKLAEEWNKLYGSIVKVCLQLEEDCQAVEYVERSKTRNLVESLTTRTLYPEGEIPPEVRQQLRQLQQAIEEEKRRLSAETSPDYSHLNELRQQYNQLYPEIPLSFGQIPPLLDGGTAIIEWYLFDDCFRAFLITRDSSQPQVWTSTAEGLEEFRKWVNDYLAGYREFKQDYADYQQAYQKVQTETEKQQIRQKIESLQQQWEKSLITRLEKLAAILHINELISLLPPHIDQLVLIPHLYLHLLPLHALPIKSNTEGADSFTPLLDKFPRGVRYIPSCQLLQKVQERQRIDFSRLLGIQTPTPDLYEADLGTVAAIKKQFTHPQTEIIRRDKATKSAILDSPERLQAANCLLFFCHGKFDWNSPLDSGLSLANDKLLTLEEIIGKFNLKNCRLVTLSACETGAIDIGNNSDEYIGLPFGFLLAGSTNVVASLWSVDAVATALLMAKFYQELQQPQANITVALKTAQNWLRQTTVAGFRKWLYHSQFSIASQEQLKKEIEHKQGATYQPFSNPYYWAAFCVIGKGV